MQKNLYPTYLLAMTTLLFLLNACATPQFVSRLEPLDQTDRWMHGRQLIELPEDRGILVDLVFQKSTPEYLIFDINIQNRSQETVLVNPLDFSLEALNADRIPINAPLMVAYNPEVVLLDIDMQESREIAHGQNSATLELISVALDAASDIASIGSEEDPAEREQELADRDARRVDYEIEQADREYRIGSLADQRDYWEHATLRKTSLDPGYRLGGSLFFPRYDEASFFHFRGLVEGRDFQVVFQQRLFQP